ncbi:pyruvate dehydrogenase E1 component subunit beta [Musa troglodytarum]|uniref:Pyruvate dehydrogenase E1 component subunit beta n=1 Tax=Musa troglodytarum TaxID=320322 RepID=A0A9E7KSE4_9LILI|nr:pyruvate dehydrogenase E1 component subunit beta [Musa troglodytarum]
MNRKLFFFLGPSIDRKMWGIARRKALQKVLPAGSVSQKKYTTAAKEMTVREALNSALDEEMSANHRVFLMGEEVGEYQGAYKDGRYPRVFSRNMVLIDSRYSNYRGIGVGAAYYGLWPVVEFMTFNFAMQAIDHIINSAAKSNYMSAGQISVPIEFRGPNDAAAGVVLCSMVCPRSWSKSVLSPYSAEDARGLLKAAIRDPDPVVFLESELLYEESFPISAEVLDSSFCLPTGKAKIEREGKHVTITSFSKMVGHALQAAEILSKEGISAEVINLRSIRPPDRATINASARKTNRRVFLNMESFEYLDAPVERIAGADVPMPYAPNLERMAVPQDINIQSNSRGQKRHFEGDGSLTPEVACLGASCAAVAVVSRTTPETLLACRLGERLHDVALSYTVASWR